MRSRGPASKSSRRSSLYPGAICRQALKPGDPIGIYGGNLVQGSPALGFEGYLINTQPDDIFTYSHDLNLEIDPQEIGNAMRFVNDDFPNCAPGEGELFIAVTPIAKGESLSWDYGVGQPALKWGRYLLGKKEEMKAYFQKHPLKTVFKKASARTPELVLQLMDKQNKGHYLFYTPAAAIYLCLSRSIKPREMLDLMIEDKDKNEVFYLKEFDQHFGWVTTTLIILEQLDEMTQKNPAIAQDITSFLLEQLEHLTMTQMVQTLHLVTQECAKPGFSPEKWTTLKERICEKMPTYEWHKDKEFVLFRPKSLSSLERLARTLKEYPQLDFALVTLGFIA